MKKSFLLLSIFLAALFSFSFTSCLEDDEESQENEEIQEDDTPVDINEYIIGKWKVYKALVTIDGQELTLPLNKNGTKTGSLKNAYLEITFQEDEKCITGIWYRLDEEDEYQWVENPASYSIDGNSVILHEANADTEFTFDENLTEDDLLHSAVLLHDYSKQIPQMIIPTQCKILKPIYQK